MNYLVINVNPGLRPLNWEGYHKKVSAKMTIGGVPPQINKPWLINPGLTLHVWLGMVSKYPLNSNEISTKYPLIATKQL